MQKAEPAKIFAEVSEAEITRAIASEFHDVLDGPGAPQTS